MTKLKHPNIAGQFIEVPNEAVAEWVAAGWLDQSKKSARTEINSPATAENSNTKETK